jgi:hypothetical protein
VGRHATQAAVMEVYCMVGWAADLERATTAAHMLGTACIIIIIPCKPYLSASATAPHPLGRRKVEQHACMHGTACMVQLQL